MTIAEDSAPETEVDEYGRERWRYGREVTTTGRGPLIEHADALNWLAAQEPDSATAIVFDPPYSRHSPMRGREDGAAGSVSAPFSFLHRTLTLCARAVKPKGIVVVFGDWKLLPDLEYLCSVTGLREQQHLAWIRSRPGGGGLFRGACDPVLIASRTPPARVDKAALKNWFLADYEIPRAHPYSKPPELLSYILGRVCRPGDLVLDPFAGSGSSRVAARKLGLEWLGADIDPQYAETANRAQAETSRAGQAEAKLAAIVAHCRAKADEFNATMPLSVRPEDIKVMGGDILAIINSDTPAPAPREASS